MANINFIKDEDLLILEYEMESQDDEDWLNKEIFEKKETNITLYKSFCFGKDDLLERKDEGIACRYKFSFGILEGDYYKIDRRKIRSSFDLFVEKSLNLDDSWFVTRSSNRNKYKDKSGIVRTTSIYGNILYAFKDFYKNEKLYIDLDDHQSFVDDGFHITKSTYKHFVDIFPSATNAKYQKLTIFTNLLKNELDVDDYSKVYEKYKKKEIKVKHTESIIPKEILINEKEKYLYARDRLVDCLNKSENGEIIHEETFSKHVTEFFCLLNPKYIKVAQHLNIDDYTRARTNSQVDLCLIDVDGNIDMIEVKSPCGHRNLFRKKPYRDHFVPCGELSGAINQLEQYLKSLTKMPPHDISERNKELQAELGDIKLRAINPKGYIIFGRNFDSFEDHNKEQKKQDFELIKSTYKNVVDIITFDELVDRFDRIIKFL